MKITFVLYLLFFISIVAQIRSEPLLFDSSITSNLQIPTRLLSYSPQDPCFPKQVHLSLGDAYYNILYDYDLVKSGDPQNAMASITWQTKAPCLNSSLTIRSDVLNSSVEVNEPSTWEDNISSQIYGNDSDGYFLILIRLIQTLLAEAYQSYSHIVMLSNLVPGIQYKYHINSGDDAGQTKEFEFTLPDPTGKNYLTKTLIYGNIDPQFDNTTLNAFNKLLESDPSAFDLQICLGGIGENISTKNDMGGDYFFRPAQNFLASWPFMITPGNQENAQNYSFLNFRTKMPLYSKTQNQYYSFNVGKIHYLSINFDFFNDNPDYEDNMYFWVQNDLKQANATRDTRPWIVVYTHKPIYCSYNPSSGSKANKCSSFYSSYKQWDNLFYKYKVDLVLQSHIPYWERTGPVYQNRSQAYYFWSIDDRNKSFINARAPVYTVEGSAGSSDMETFEPTPLAEFSMNYDTKIGYSKLTVVNSTALHYEHIDSSNGDVLDEFYLLKGDEYPYPASMTSQEPSSSYSGNLSWMIISSVIILLILISLFVLGYKANKEVQPAPRQEPYQLFNEAGNL